MMHTIVGSSWIEGLGAQIRAARARAGLSQKALGKLVGKSRNMIGRYETGMDAPSLDVFARIATQLRITEVSLNGHKFLVQPSKGVAVVDDAAHQLRLDFDKEYVYPGTVLKITPSGVQITITAMAPLAG